MPGDPTLLRVLITQRHWQSYETFVTQFENAADDLAARESDPRIRRLSIERRQFERWLSGAVKTRPRPDHCRVLEHLFGYPIDDLLAPVATGRKPSGTMAQTQAQEDLAADSESPAFLRSATIQAGPHERLVDLERELAMTAHESSEHAGFVASHGLAPASLEQVHDHVVQLARQFAYCERSGNSPGGRSENPTPRPVTF